MKNSNSQKEQCSTLEEVVEMKEGSKILNSMVFELPASGEHICYVLTEEEGKDREVFDTACSKIYNLTIAQENELGNRETCCLVDIARGESAAFAIFSWFVRAGATPYTAQDLMEELLATQNI